MVADVTSVFPSALQPYAPLIIGIAKALVILILAWIGAKWAHAVSLSTFRKRKIEEAVSRFLAMLVQYAVLAAGVIAAIQAVGIATTSLVAILGSAALAIGLALQGSLSHFAAGVMVLLNRPFSIGDVITAAGETGKVDEIGLFATVLITPENHKIIIPNGSVIGGSITNLTVLGTRRGDVPVGVAYGSDPDKVIQVLVDTAKQLEGVLAEPEPAAILVGFGASSVDFKLTFFAKSDEWFAVSGRARIAVYEALDAAGIEIPFDQLVLHKAEAAS